MTVTRDQVEQMRRRIDKVPSVDRLVPETADNIIEFATAPQFLGLRLFPAQGTILKAITLCPDLYTDFDRALLEEWQSGFDLEQEEDGFRYQGSKGTTPDLDRRIEWCQDQGLPWASEVLLVLGRRGSKNFLASIMITWALWQMLQRADPHEHYELPPDKAIGMYVLGANLDQARRNGFADIASLLSNADCFRPFFGKRTATSVTLLTQAQLRQGLRPGLDEGALQVIAAASTPTSVRGPAVAGLVLDEFAHVERGTSAADSVEIYRSSRAALAQFVDRLIIQISSPWQRTGQLYLSHTAALRTGLDQRTPVNPDLVAFQLPSTELYREAEASQDIELWPGGPTFGSPMAPKITQAMVDRELRLDPVSARVEYLAQYASVLDAYLTPDVIDEIFGPYLGQPLTQQVRGRLGTTYAAHADPSRVNDNFALAIGHLEAAEPYPMVVFDYLGGWRPTDFPGHRINYKTVLEELKVLIAAFGIAEMTFDQWNSAGAIDELEAWSKTAGLARRPRIYERPANQGVNWQMAQIYKAAANSGMVHAPGHDLARAEHEFLMQRGDRVDHPTSGPVQTKDMVDAMMNVTFTLLQGCGDVFERLGGFRLSASVPGPGAPVATIPTNDMSAEFTRAGRLFARAHRPRKV